MFFMSGKTLPTKREGKTDWNWASYFALKKQKLQEQFKEQNSDSLESNKDVDEESKYLFKDVGIFVNGYTNPTAIELKSIMHRYGGTFFEYPNEYITHYIATNLAHSKALAFRNKLVVKPHWILDCIKEKRILSTDAYLVITRHDKNQNKLTFTPKNLSRLKTVNKLEDSRVIKVNPNKPSVKRPVIPVYQTEYKCFKQKIAEFELPDHVNMNQQRHELKREKIKHLLSDWIFSTSRNQSINIDSDDLNVFKGYLFYLLNVRKQFEELYFILKILKRLIEKNGSFEWIEAYKELVTSIQSDFYLEFDSKIQLD